MLVTGAQIGVVAGALAIEVAFSILIAIALDQFIQIQEARPKLLDAVELAKQTVNLNAMLAEPTGKDQLTYFWSKAMDATVVRDDQQVLTKARAAMEIAKQQGFKVPATQ